MSDVHTLLKARLSIVRRDLDEVVTRLDQDMMDWAPAPGMRTISGQLLEIAVTEMQALGQLKEGRSVTGEEGKAIIGNFADLETLKVALARARQETLDYVDSLSEKELGEEVGIPTPWFESLGLPSVPRSEVIRSMAMHEWYHVGQLATYLWARGDNPYRW